MTTPEPEKRPFPAKVAKVLDDLHLVLNRGQRDGVKYGQRFLIYAIGAEPIVDPETRENLGQLEIVRGTGKVVHLQDQMCTIESDTKRRTERTVIKRHSFPLGWGQEVEEIIAPTEPGTFTDPRIGDNARPV